MALKQQGQIIHIYCIAIDMSNPGALYIGHVSNTLNRTPRQYFFSVYPDGFCFQGKVSLLPSQASLPPHFLRLSRDTKYGCFAESSLAVMCHHPLNLIEEMLTSCRQL